MINKNLKECILQTNNTNHEVVISRISTVRSKELLHAALGMSSELGEVFAAIKKNDMTNLVEELGDIMWYHGLAELTLFPESSDKANHYLQLELVPYTEKISAKTKDLSIDLVESVSDFVDVIKKSVIYGKSVDDFQIELKLNKIHGIVRNMANSSGVSLDTVCNVVVQKLSKRYKGGYTDNKAITRDLKLERETMESQVEKIRK